MSTFIADRVESYDIIVGDKQAYDCGRIGFVNTIEALELLNKHIAGNKPIAVHADIDVDGIGTAYIMYKLLLSQGVINRTGFIINKEKEHGIMQKHVDYFSKIKIGLLIVLDSSSNEIEYIKQMNCDVLVIDHHEILHGELKGKTAGGEYVIVSNMIDNKQANEINEWLKGKTNKSDEYVADYKTEERMSCGLVLYELLKIYEIAYNVDDVLERAMLYQWVGITLFTDAIQLGNERNQYYIERTVHNMEVEPGLNIMMQKLNNFQAKPDKSFINFTFAPAINKAIRAGASSEALDIVLNRQQDIINLLKYKDEQDSIVENYMEGTEIHDTYAIKNVSELGIHRNYCGILATKIREELNKNAAVYILNENGIAEGSFRGRLSGIDYRKKFEAYEDGIYAQGHKTAFGFKVERNKLGNILNSLSDIESYEGRRWYVTVGASMLDSDKGKYHIMDMENFKRQGNIWKVAMANSKLSSDESIHIVGNYSDLQFIEQKGKVYFYTMLGLSCMAFEEINTRLVDIYVEYSTDIKIYVKNIRE